MMLKKMIKRVVKFLYFRLKCYLDEDWATLMDLCGTPQRKLPRNNPTPKQHSPEFSSQAKARMAELYHEDFELLSDIYAPKMTHDQIHGR